MTQSRRDESYPAKKAQTSAQLPSSQGDAPRETLPECEQHHEHLLDEAVRESFPASDPIAPPKEFVDEGHTMEEDEEMLIDAAIEMTFPASDPIAVDACIDLPKEHKQVHFQPYHPSA